MELVCAAWCTGPLLPAARWQPTHPPYSAYNKTGAVPEVGVPGPRCLTLGLSYTPVWPHRARKPKRESMLPFPRALLPVAASGWEHGGEATPPEPAPAGLG